MRRKRGRALGIARLVGWLISVMADDAPAHHSDSGNLMGLFGGLATVPWPAIDLVSEPRI